MRRQDVRLLTSARGGDVAARCEVGRRYLLGIEGFPRHFDVGLEYLTHPSLGRCELAARTIADALPLHELLRRNLLPILAAAARAGSGVAQLKLGTWHCLTSQGVAEAVPLLERAAAAGSTSARAALQATKQGERNPAAAVLAALTGEEGIDASRLVVQAMTDALRSNDSQHIARMLECALAGPSWSRPELADVVCTALGQVQHEARFPVSCDNAKIEALLEDCVRRGNATAALLLGRALSGFDTCALPAALLTTGRNLRRGAALLLRAADAGVSEAWMLLHRLHADNRTSVANHQMASYFLEKAAAAGDVTAQRRLGALILRSAAGLHDSEQGIQWLHRAADQQDGLAMQLLSSLVLPVAGPETEATCAIEALRREDPWLACRLRTARDFGLTKLEAMSVDIMAGFRPWGLVVGQNASVVQTRLAAPRAIPALHSHVIENLRRSVAFLEQSRQDDALTAGDRRRRTHRLRYWLDRSGVDEALFFAEARSMTLSSLRQGPKWAFHVRQSLRMALAA